MNINSITASDIKDLSPNQLTQVLRMLVHLEVEKFGMVGFYYVSQNITVADGGEDGYVKVDDKLGSSNLPLSEVIFQCKATNMTPAKCKEEILEPPKKGEASRTLKPIIKKVLDDGGAYILFTSINAGARSPVTKKENKIWEGIKEAGLNYKKEQIKVYDGQKISDWANDHIPVKTYILECNNKTKLEGFRTWEQWKLDIATSLFFPFEKDELKNKMQELKNTLENGNVVRIVGHSGIGKTRLAFETTAPDGDDLDSKQNILNASIVYYDYGLMPSTELAKYIVNFKSGTVATVVIDNCPEDIHRGIAAIVQSNSKIKIITIDYSLDSDERNLIILTKEDQRKTVARMLSTLYPTYTEIEINKLAELAEGYPRMVELLKDAILKSSINPFNPQLPKEFVSKLVFGRGSENTSEYDIIRCCSIFSEFHFVDEENEDLLDTKKLQELSVHKNFIASEICDPAIAPQSFYRACRNFKTNRKIMERRGNYFTVVPTPLAAHLAADWLLNFPPENFEHFSLRLVQTGLIDAFCKRLKTLDQIDRAKSLVLKLWGPSGPFSTAEVLNTKLGSRLFRSVVEVNPEATIEALYEFTVGRSVPQLREINEGRRNLIWALEKLVFRQEIFDMAAQVLARFAAGENEMNISNNATGQFRQLFHIFLPGTEADLEQRISLLDFCLAQPEREYHVLAVRAMAQAFKTEGFHRTGGAESQGSGKRMVDYQAKTWDEIYRYWERCLERLYLLASGSPDLLPEVKKIVASSIRGLITKGRFELVENFIKKFISLDPSLWPEAISQLKKAIRFDLRNEEAKAVTNSLLESLLPKDWDNQVKYTVSVPDWDYEELANGDVRDRSSEKVRALIEKMIRDGVSVEDYLPQLSRGEQRRGGIFGRLLGDLSMNKLEVGTKVIKSLSETPQNEQNPDLLAGYLSGLDPAIRLPLFDSIISNHAISKFAFHVSRFYEPDMGEINKLFTLVDSNETSVSFFANLIFAGNKKLKIDEVIDICKRIFTYGEKGRWTALDLLDQFAHYDEGSWEAVKNTLKEFVMGTNFLMIKELRNSNMELFRWSRTTMKLLDQAGDVDLAKHISNNINEAARGNDFDTFDVGLKNVCVILIKQYFDLFWNIISDSFISDSLAYFNLKHLLGSHNGNGAASGILFDGDFSVILNWCEKNQPKAPKRIAYMMPLINTSSDKIAWHPIAVEMIDKFGELPGFLDEIAANLGSFSSIGSVIPYYQNNQELMRSLLDHKIAKVRKWAKDGVKHYEKLIRKEKLSDEEDHIG